MSEELKQWRDAGNHLPEFMRDFHDQKDVFKAIAAIPAPSDTIAAAEITWPQAHVYTIDRFLWFMARHGYVLRKSGAKLPFHDIAATLKDATDTRRDAEASILRAALDLQKPVNN